MALYEKTIELLKNRPRDKTLKSISEDTGINLSWLRSFGQGRIKDKGPSVFTVEKLYEYLSGQKLKV